MKTIRCNDAIDLLNNIGSDTELILTQGCYDITNIDFDFDMSVYYNTELPFEQRELNLRKVSNLRIIGQGAETKIITSHTYANVLAFIGCTGIHIEKISFGHYPEFGGCTGNVLSFQDCNDITIVGCELFGCGCIGVTCKDCERVEMHDTLVTHCTERIFSLHSSRYIHFANCNFIHNECNSFVISHSFDVKIDGCVAKNNTKNEYENEYFVNIVNSCDRIDVRNNEFESATIRMDRESATRDILFFNIDPKGGIYHPS